jgi:hypothetical protein
MREKRLDLASNANYATGPVTGTPTKIAPPTVNFSDGKIPDQAFGAQWQNYIEYYLQRQIEISAQVPFRNWQEYAGVGSTSGLSGGSGSVGNVRAAFNKRTGDTYFTKGANNSAHWVLEVQPDPGTTSLPSVSFTPAAGTFVCKGVASVEDSTDPSWLFVGSNSTAPTKTIFKRTLSADTEVTSPVSGGVELICKDRTTGYFYAFAADTNRSVLVHGPNTSDTWSVLGQRGAGAPAPAYNSMYCTAANGLLLLAYTTTPGSTQITVERMVTGTFSRTVFTGFSSTSKVLDVAFSPQFGEFMLMAADGVRRFADTSSGFTLVTAGYPTAALAPVLGVVSGCLHDTGAAVIGDGRLFVQPWLGDPSHLMQFDPSGPPSGLNKVLFDGSSLWLLFATTGGATRIARSLRSN